MHAGGSAARVLRDWRNGPCLSHRLRLRARRARFAVGVAVRDDAGLPHRVRVSTAVVSTAVGLPFDGSASAAVACL